jgi:hypothetical protein
VTSGRRCGDASIFAQVPSLLPIVHHLYPYTCWGSLSVVLGGVGLPGPLTASPVTSVSEPGHGLLLRVPLLLRGVARYARCAYVPGPWQPCVLVWITVRWTIICTDISIWIV